MNPAVCDYCIKPNVDYTFSVAAVLEDSQLGPAATVNQAVGTQLNLAVLANRKN